MITTLLSSIFVFFGGAFIAMILTIPLLIIDHLKIKMHRFWYKAPAVIAFSCLAYTLLTIGFITWIIPLHPNLFLPIDIPSGLIIMGRIVCTIGFIYTLYYIIKQFPSKSEEKKKLISWLLVKKQNLETEIPFKQKQLEAINWKISELQNNRLSIEEELEMLESYDK